MNRDELDAVRWRAAAKIASEALDRIADKVIRELKGLPEDCRLSGEDSPYKDVWEEYKTQIQGSESIFFDVYEEDIRMRAMVIVEDLNRDLQGLLWLATEGSWNEEWYDEESGELKEIPFGDPVTRDLIDAICSIVAERAGNEEMAHDEEEGTQEVDESWGDDETEDDDEASEGDTNP